MKAVLSIFSGFFIEKFYGNDSASLFILRIKVCVSSIFYYYFFYLKQYLPSLSIHKNVHFTQIYLLLKLYQITTHIYHITSQQINVFA